MCVCVYTIYIYIYIYIYISRQYWINKHSSENVISYIFHATTLYLQKFNTNLLHNTFLLSVNFLTRFGLTFWPSSGSVVTCAPFVATYLLEFSLVIKLLLCLQFLESKLYLYTVKMKLNTGSNSNPVPTLKHISMFYVLDFPPIKIQLFGHNIILNCVLIL
jgi:hypothetical protein